LVTKECKIKIADFGLARIYPLNQGPMTSVVVTLWYRSPEVLLHSSYSSSVDIWSLGCIFAELYLKRPLFAGKSDIDQLYKIYEIMGLPSQQDWPEQSVIPLESFKKNFNLIKLNGGRSMANNSNHLKDLMSQMNINDFDLLQKMLHLNVNERITASEAINHVYFELISINSVDNTQNQLTNAYLASIENIDPFVSTKLNTSFNNNDKTPTSENISFLQPNILKRKRLQSIPNGATSTINQK
jgi:cyclin-dependent kinase 6